MLNNSEIKESDPYIKKLFPLRSSRFVCYCALCDVNSFEFGNVEEDTNGWLSVKLEDQPYVAWVCPYCQPSEDEE